MEMAKRSGHERHKSARRMDQRILSHLGVRGAFLEIGCGPGFFLAEMRDLGWDVQGLEISAYAARYAAEKLGLDVSVSRLEPETFSRESFDVVFMGDVLEHLPDPIRSLNAVRTWLRIGGVLVIAGPSTMNLLSARIGLALYGIRKRFKTLRIPPYHLFEYAPDSLRATVEASGLALVELQQSAVPIRKMGLRGTFVENAGKVSLQVLSHLTARIFNRGGDRLLAVAQRRES